MNQDQNTQANQNILPTVAQNITTQKFHQNKTKKQREDPQKEWWTFRKKIFIICFITVLIIIGLGLGLGIGLTIAKGQRQQSSTYISDVQFQSNIILRASESVTEGQYSSTIQVSHNKTQVVSQDIGLILSKINVNQSQYVTIVPIFQLLLHTQYYLRKQHKPSINFFDEYNKNPSGFSQKLKLALSQLMPHYNTNKNKTLKLIGIQQKMMIELQYNPELKIFTIAQTPDDLNISSQIPQINQSISNENQHERSSFQTNSKQADDFSNRTALFLLDIISRNLKVLQQNSLNNSTQGKRAQGTDLTDNWQKLLIEKCKSVSILRYQCSYTAVQLLVPGFKKDNAEETLPKNSILTYALSVQFKQIGPNPSSS